MKDEMVAVLEQGGKVLALVLMGVFGVGLLTRLIRLVRGEESADGSERASFGEAGIRAMLLAAAVAIASRMVLYGIAWAMHSLHWGGGFWQTLEPLWTHWDTRHYLGIAENGYVATGDERLRLVFFPLYPWLMRWLSPLAGGSFFHAGLLISLLCTGVAAAMLYALCFPYGGGRFAALCLAYFLLSPSSVFLGACYTEALFLALTLSAMVLLRRGHPWLAALCGMGSALTRMPGVIVSGLFLIALLAEIPKGRFHLRAVLRCAGQMGIVFAGFGLYLLLNWNVTGSPTTYLIYQKENWFQSPGTFWDSTANTIHYFFSTMGDEDWLFSWGYQLVCMLGMFLLLAMRGNALPFDLAAYSFVYTCVVLAPTWLLSAPRYLFALAPLPMLRARLTDKRLDHALMLALSAAWLVLWVYGFAIAGDVL